MERETKLVFYSLAIDVSPLFAYSGFAPQANRLRTWLARATRAKCNFTLYLQANKKKSFSGLLFISGRRGSNSRHLPWQGSILPLNYPRNSLIRRLYMNQKIFQVLFLTMLSETLQYNSQVQIFCPKALLQRYPLLFLSFQNPLM